MAYLLNAGIGLALNNTPTTTATYASGGAAGSTSVVISASNPNIIVGQDITGTGFAGNTKVTGISGTTVTFSPAAISQVAGTINFKTWYYLTDHNRREISVVPELIQKESRMANGTLKKFVVSKKDVIATSWENVPSSNKQATPLSIISATVTGSNIIYVTSANHNFSTGSVVKISGFNNDKLNITTPVISGVTNSFIVSNTKNASNGTTNANTTTTATYSSGGSSGSNTFVISTPNASIEVSQSITGTGFDTNTTVTAINGTTITFSPVAKTQISGTITFSAPAASVVEILPSITTVDGNYGASWLSSFYNSNVGIPLYLKLTSSKHTDPSLGTVPTDSTFTSAKSTSKIYNVFITSFSSTISKRTSTTDYINMDIEFTEI